MHHRSGFEAVTAGQAESRSDGAWAAGPCEELGLQYWQHIVALLVPVREGQLRSPRRGAAGSRAASHADLFVFRKPSPATARSQAATAEAA